jgi:dienelactone hydrolase
MRTLLLPALSVFLATGFLATGMVAAGVRLSAAADDHPRGDRDREVVVAEYDFGDTAFTDPASGTVSELRAVVHYPRHAAGRLPLIIQSHGSWWACDDQAAAKWPCENGSRPFPSYRGYDYLADALAKRGFVVASISADGINQTSFDYGDRARLINEHLRLWRDLDAGQGPLTARLAALTGHVDLGQVGTMGHSRGGKGVMWQASDKHRHEWPAGVVIKAVLPLAPVKFDHPEGDNSDTLVTAIPIGVVTGTCDGAVGEGGQAYLDDVEGKSAAPAHSVSIRDANHNYFNTRWTPPSLFGDDDSTCPDRELSPGTQQTALTAYAVAFYERYLHGDRSFDAVLTGGQPLPGVTSTTRLVAPR